MVGFIIGILIGIFTVMIIFLFLGIKEDTDFYDEDEEDGYSLPCEESDEEE